MITQKEIIGIGTISRTHGKQGDLQCQTENDLLAESDPEWIILEIEGIPVPFRLDDWREKSGESYILTLHDIDSEDKALRLCGCKAFLLRREISDEPQQALTMRDLIGFAVIDAAKGPVGKIIDVDESTLNTLFLLEGDIVIPAHDDFVQDINYDTRQLFLSLPEGLI